MIYLIVKIISYFF